MEKQIKMSLETARKMYEHNKNYGYEPLLDFLLENFTKEELEGGGGYAWEDSFNGGGVYINSTSEIIKVGPSFTKSKINKSVFKTESHAKSALAFAQLSYIVDKYNEGKTTTVFNGVPIFHYLQAYNDGNIRVISCNDLPSSLPILMFFFLDRKDAETSLRVNRKLWDDYFMLNGTTTYVLDTNA